MNACTRGALLVATLFGLAASHAPDLSAQSGRATFLAIPESFPSIDARALIVRTPERDVVLLRADEATPEALAMCLLALRKVGERSPAPVQGQLIPVTGYALTTELEPRQRERLEAELARLGTQPVTRVGTFGPGRWMPIATR